MAAIAASKSTQMLLKKHFYKIKNQNGLIKFKLYLVASWMAIHNGPLDKKYDF